MTEKKRESKEEREAMQVFKRRIATATDEYNVTMRNIKSGIKSQCPKCKRGFYDKETATAHAIKTKHWGDYNVH